MSYGNRKCHLYWINGHYVEKGIHIPYLVQIVPHWMGRVTGVEWVTYHGQQRDEVDDGIAVIKECSIKMHFSSPVLVLSNWSACLFLVIPSTV